MENPAREEVTVLLGRLAQGDDAAAAKLIPIVYGELRRLAAAYMRRERKEHTLQPTALVHEAYLKLMEQREVDWQSRAHFFGIAAQTMRRILIDHARAHMRDKRGGDHTLVHPGQRLARTLRVMRERGSRGHFRAVRTRETARSRMIGEPAGDEMRLSLATPY